METLVAFIVLALTLGRTRPGTSSAPVVIDGTANGWPWRARKYSDVTGEKYAVGLFVEMVSTATCDVRSAVVDNETEALNQTQVWAVEQGAAPEGLSCPWSA